VLRRWSQTAFLVRPPCLKVCPGLGAPALLARPLPFTLDMMRPQPRSNRLPWAWANPFIMGSVDIEVLALSSCPCEFISIFVYTFFCFSLYLPPATQCLSFSRLLCSCCCPAHCIVMLIFDYTQPHCCCCRKRVSEWVARAQSFISAAH